MKEMNKTLVTPRDLKKVNTMLYELLMLRRWSEFEVNTGKFTELAKQAINCMIAFFWAMEARFYGSKIDLTVFPKIAICRGFQKTIQCDIPEGNLDHIFSLGNIDKENFAQMVWDNFTGCTSREFHNHMIVDQNSVESKIYRGATKIATYLELLDIRGTISEVDFQRKSDEIFQSLYEYHSLPGFTEMLSESYTQIFRNFAKLRNRIRWAKHPNLVKCSVLGHLFDVAVYAYLMSLEVNPENEELATQYFFMGIFHDFPETWTGDMPSPIKDSIPGLRKATEMFENEVMENHVYCLLIPEVAHELKSVMLEDEENETYKKFLKKSDNFSAFIECWREIDAGTRHPYYIDVFRRDYSDRDSLPKNFKELSEFLYTSVYSHL